MKAIKILLGGSPCTFWSIAQRNNREITAKGMGWELFKNYLVAKEKFKPDFFLYENNKSASQAIKDQIACKLGVGSDTNVRFTYINSSLVSAQNRERFYVTNYGDIKQPTDRCILLRDVLEYGATPLNLTSEGKARTIRATCYKDGIRNMVGNEVDRKTCVAEPISYTTPIEWDENGKPTKAVTHSDGKIHMVYEVKDGLIPIKCKQHPIELANGFYIIRKLTVRECARLQTMPDNYCKAVSNTQAYKALGNGWTAEVIVHLLNHALKDIPHDTEIVVLSLYDGIATGRYCLDKLGFTNVTYHAYEIDKHAMSVAMDNYPDIIQHGDAFAVRDDNWTPPHTCSEWLDGLLGGVV